jgi:hypothetical protein
VIIADEPLPVPQHPHFPCIGFQIEVFLHHAVAPVVPDPEVTDGRNRSLTASDNQLLILFFDRTVNAGDQRPALIGTAVLALAIVADSLSPFAEKDPSYSC